MLNTRERTQSLWWNRPVVYWLENQVVLTFQSRLRVTDGFPDIIGTLKLDSLNQFLTMGGFELKPFPSRDLVHPPDTSKEESENREAERDLTSPAGKYLFRAPSGMGTLVVCLFQAVAHDTGSAFHMQAVHGNQNCCTCEADATGAVVSYINQNIDRLKRNGNIPIIAAMPNWVGGGTNGDTGGQVGHGCPVTPPIPVEGDTQRWPLRLPQLSETMQGMTGEDVTVFVLDTLPTMEQIQNAAIAAGDNNQLLQDMLACIEGTATSPRSMILGNQQMPSIITNIQTGKDIFGRLFGFNMPDHGLFIAGMIHDLAPKAKIECVRVLNDFGIGTFSTICPALQEIQRRMLAGNLGQVVVNLSLVITPADEEIADLLFMETMYHVSDFDAMKKEVELVRACLHLIIQSLTSQGAVVVASAGNDSMVGMPDMGMDAGMAMGLPQRFGPRYPAAFPEVIAVGAVDKYGDAAPYSDAPTSLSQPHGIATYGGNRPMVAPNPLPPLVPQPPAGAKTWAIVDDALIGVYSSPGYSMLSADDLPPADYAAPADNHAWAYWAGTSFATPIISALAARILQARAIGVLGQTLSVQDVITTAYGQHTILDEEISLSTTDYGTPGGVARVLLVEQGSSVGVSEGVGEPTGMAMPGM